MSAPASQAFATDFSHTAGASDVVFTFASGVLSVPVTIPTSTYRMWLAPLVGCFPRTVTNTCTTELTLVRGAAYTCIASLSAAGIFTLRIVSASGLPTAVTFADGIWQRLGFSSATPTLTAGTGLVDIVGTRPVWHLAILAAATGPYWQPSQAGGAEVTAGGVVYAVAASLTAWSRTLKVSFQPTTPTYRATHGCEATAMCPDEQYMNSLGELAARESSVYDVIQGARNASCGYTNDWRTARTDSNARFWRAYLAPETLLSASTTPQRAEWLAYCAWELGLVAPSSAASETRA